MSHRGFFGVEEMTIIGYNHIQISKNASFTKILLSETLNTYQKHDSGIEDNFVNVKKASLAHIHGSS